MGTIIFMFRQDEIPEEAEKRLRELLGQTGIFQLVREDPDTAIEHNTACLENDVKVVILPCEQPNKSLNPCPF